MNLKTIACNVFFREICHVAARSINKIDVEFLSRGLHDIETKDMAARLQEAIDASSDPALGYNYILLGYALCNNAAVGLKARTVPLVIPKAHDCITVFMGSRQKYSDYFNANPGVYFHTAGWIERSETTDELKRQSIQRKSGMDLSYEELVREYGEDNAQYLCETLCDPAHNYSRFAFIEMGMDSDGRFEDFSRNEARTNGWEFEKIKGDLSLLQRFMDGKWDKNEFLIVQPGQSIVASYDDSVLKVTPTKPE